MLLISASNDSGKPEVLPSQSERPDKLDRDVLRLVGGAGIGLVGVEDAEGLLYAALKSVSVGKRDGSLILPLIQRCTRWMYWTAGILIGRFA